MTNKIAQSFYSVYSYSGVESIERALNLLLYFTLILYDISNVIHIYTL